MSTTQPTVEEQVELGARALFCFHEEWNLDRMFSDSVNAWFQSKEADEKEVVDGLKAQVRAVLAALRPPVEVGGLVDDPVEPHAASDCPKGSCQRHGRCMYVNHPLCPETLTQAAEIERLRRGPEGDAVQNLLTALEKVLPISTRNTPDYAELTFGDHATQAMTMAPDDWSAIQSAYEAIAAALTSLSGELEGKKIEARVVTDERDHFARQNAELRSALVEFEAGERAAEAALAKAVEALEDIALAKRFEATITRNGGQAVVKFDDGSEAAGRVGELVLGLTESLVLLAKTASETLASISPVKGMKTNG